MVVKINNFAGNTVVYKEQESPVSTLFHHSVLTYKITTCLREDSHIKRTGVDARGIF